MGVSRRNFLEAGAATIVAPLLLGSSGKQNRDTVVVDPYRATGDVKTLGEGIALMGGRKHTITYGPLGGELIIRAN